MRNFPTKEALVRAYWRKLTSSIEVAYKSRGRVSAGGAARPFQTRQGRASRSEAATARARLDSVFIK
jgi:hypothetical protein